MNRIGEAVSEADPLAFLMGGGETGQLIRSLDWSTSALGPVAGWPQSLRTALSICMASDLPICVIWGPGRVQLYNDAYRVICGDKHPRSMGQNFAECWREAWSVIGQAHDSAFTGATAFLQSQHIFLERHGYVEECFFTFSFSPIRNEAGAVGGLFHPVIEMTTQMLSERRTRALRDLTAHTSNAKSMEEALALSAETLANYRPDLPFALLFAIDSGDGQARLVGSTGLKADAFANVGTVSLSEDEPGFWHVAEVARSGVAVSIDDSGQRISAIASSPYLEPPKAALVLPIIRPGADAPTAIFVAGISPRLPMNEAYRTFCDMLASNVATAVANAAAFDAERRRARALVELDRAKTVFFSNISHEFRTPLTLMLGPVDDALAALDEPLPPLQRERLELVHRNGLRLGRLVNSLLDFSRIEAGRVRAAYEATDLADFTADLASNFRSACHTAGLELRVHCVPLDEPVFVDRPMWEKVVLNLLSNAFKFTFEGRISVSLRQTGRAVELCVQDTGTGIPAADIPLLFERFHRVENARGRTHEGSGIGLALVQELVQLHGGSVVVESELGKGTSFAVSIPLGAQHLPGDQVANGSTAVPPSLAASPFVEEALRWLPDADRSRAAVLGNASLQGKPAGAIASSTSTEDDRPLVLVADDNADMRQYIVRLLAGHYRTEAVPDGEAALAATRRRTPDLVLTDVMMPRLDGFGLLHALRADPRMGGVPIIMLSARAGEESRVEGMHEGADDYLVKPFSARELLARVTAHLQMARLRRESSQSLRQSNERLNMALTAARMVTWQVELATGSFVVSDNAPDVFGLPAASVVQFREDWYALVDPADLDHYRATVDKEVSRCGSYVSQFRIVRKDNGAVIWLEERGHGVGEGPGQAVRLFGVVMDITQRVLAEAATRASEGRSRAILESITDGFFALDRDWRFTYVNAAGEKFLDRVTPGDLVGKQLWEEYPGTVGSEFERVYRRVAVGRVGESFTARYPNFDRWYEVTAYPAPEGLSVYFRDVTAQRHTEERLRASEERRRLALDAAELGMWHVDPATRALQTDSRFRAIFGMTEAWPDYSQVFSVIHPDDQAAVQAAVDAATRLEDPTPYAIEYRVVHPDGSLRWVFAKGRLNAEGDGASNQTVSFDGTVADITERKYGEEERERLVATLREQDQRKDEFLATLAHELRNPLAPIRNGLHILRLATPDPQATEAVRSMMERQLGQMVHLIDDLMDLSRINRGTIDLRKERIELSSAIQQAVETSQPAINQADHALVIDVPAESIPVDADLTRLTQVFSNLLGNAAKYTGRSGRIRLTLQQHGQEAVVCIEDSGIGIPSHMLKRVFEMFTRVDRPLDLVHSGLGVGLSIVQRLVQMHGGSVEAQSDGDGRGSRFIVRLPVALPLVANASVATADPPHPTALRRILVADDNVDAAKSLGLLLTLMGNETQTAHDGAEAIAMAAAFRPDIVFLDLGMPKRNGYEVCRRLRQETWGKDMLVIALTGWGQEEDRRLSLEAGFDAHVVKPVLPADLEKLLTGAPATGIRSNQRGLIGRS